MKAGIYSTGSGPIVILTSYDSLAAGPLVEKLQAKGIRKFIAYDVPVEKVKEKYGTKFQSVLNDLKQEDDLRVLDFDGQHVFNSFRFGELGKPLYFES